MPSQQNKPITEQHGVSVIQSQTLSGATLPTEAGLQQVPQLVPVSSSSGGGGGGGGGKAMAPSRVKKGGGGGGGGGSMDKESEEYRARRERNNLAVKKSRMRSKQKAADTQQRVNELKEENERLEAKIKLLSKELSVLKDLFLEHAHNLADNNNASAAAATAVGAATGAGPASAADMCGAHGNNNNKNSGVGL